MDSSFSRLKETHNSIKDDCIHHSLNKGISKIKSREKNLFLLQEKVRKSESKEFEYMFVISELCREKAKTRIIMEEMRDKIRTYEQNSVSINIRKINGPKLNMTVKMIIGIFFS